MADCSSLFTRFSFKLLFSIPENADFCPRSCACKIISRIERPQAPMLSGNRRSVARHSLLPPLVYSDNQQPNSNLQTPFSVHLVILPQILQTRARVTLSAGWGKIQHNQRGGSVPSIKLPSSLHRVVLVHSPNPSLSPSLSPSPNNSSSSSSRAVACSGTPVRLGLKISLQADLVSVVAITCTYV